MASTGASAFTPNDAERRAGLIAVAVAHIMWGFLPLYLKLVQDVDVREVLAQRIIWSIPAALIAVFAFSGVKRGLREIGAAMRPGMLGALTLSALFICANWGAYVWLVMEARVIEASLAYFLSPLIGVAIGVVFFGETLRTSQTLALLLAAVGVIVQGVALGGVPWPTLFLCLTWSLYAVIRKRAPVPAATGLLVETLALAPIAGVLLWWAAQSAPIALGADLNHTLLLMLAGPITAIPLMAFAFGARRVSFVALGLLQFLTPTLQFSIGIAFGEPFTLLRAVSFTLIWAGLGLFAWDTWKRAHNA